MEKVNAMTEKQVEEFYDACPDGYEVEEKRMFDMVSMQMQVAVSRLKP